MALTTRQKLEAVTEIVRDMQSIAAHGAFISRDPYDYTEALRAVLGLPETER